MKRIIWNQDQELLQAELLGVTPTLLYLLTRGRNAWQSTWVKTYKGPTALVADLSTAKAGAERQRKQGSVFYIREVPGIALLSDQGPIALAEFHSDNCFGKWDVSRGSEYLRLGTPIASTLRSLGPNGDWRKPVPSEDSFISGKAAWKSLKTLSGNRPLKFWTSQAHGTDRYLEWTQRPGNYSKRGVNAIMRCFDAVNPADARDAAAAKYWAIANAEVERKAEESRLAMEQAMEEFEATMKDLFGPEWGTT